MRRAPVFSVAVAAVAALAALAAVAVVGWRACRDSGEEEEEERDLARDHFWRTEVHIEGAGTVSAADGSIRCASDGTTQTGACGPRLFVFRELKPPLLTAAPEPGWRLLRWTSRIRELDGAVRPRSGPMPDGRFYINGFGYSDTGELDTVTAVFVRDED